MSSYTIPPALHAILSDANNIAPGRSTASDGTIGDAAHRAEVSDHNPAPGTGVVHAVDVTNDPAHGMDTWQWAQIIASRIIAGLETRVKYLVSNNGTHDVIFNPSVSLTWRLNNAEGGQSHRSHLHTSILYTPAAENDIRPYFVRGAPAPPAPSPPLVATGKAEAMILYKSEPHRFWLDPEGDLWQQWAGFKPVNLSAVGRTKYGGHFSAMDRTQPVEFVFDPYHDGVCYGQTTSKDGWLCAWVYFGGWDVTPYAPA